MAPRGKNKGGGYKSGKTPAKVLMPDVLHLLLLGVTREHAQDGTLVWKPSAEAPGALESSVSPMELGTLLEWFAGLLAVLPEAAAAELKIATKLDKQQRARVHEFVTAKFDRQLETTSRGVDEARCIHVTRKGAAAAARPALGEEQEAKAKLLYRAARAAGLANMSADEIRDRIAGDDLGAELEALWATQQRVEALCLAAHGGDLDALRAALAAAAAAGDQAAALANGVDARSGSRPLHCAAAMGQVEALRLLVAAGADLEARDEKGATPLQAARRAEQCDAEAVLLQLGASDPEKGSFPLAAPPPAAAATATTDATAAAGNGSSSNTTAGNATSYVAAPAAFQALKHAVEEENAAVAEAAPTPPAAAADAGGTAAPAAAAAVAAVAAKENTAVADQAAAADKPAAQPIDQVATWGPSDGAAETAEPRPRGSPAVPAAETQQPKHGPASSTAALPTVEPAASAVATRGAPPANGRHAAEALEPAASMTSAKPAATAAAAAPASTSAAASTSVAASEQPAPSAVAPAATAASSSSVAKAVAPPPPPAQTASTAAATGGVIGRLGEYAALLPAPAASYAQRWLTWAAEHPTEVAVGSAAIVAAGTVAVSFIVSSSRRARH